MITKFLFHDFEFSRSEEKDLRLFCDSFDLYEDGKLTASSDVWLLDDEKMQNKLRDYYESLRKDTAFVCFGSAEQRCMLQLGLDPHKFMIIDLFQEGQQLRHNHDDYLYGVRFEKGFKRTSRPPSYDPKQNIGKDNKKTHSSYAGTVAYLFHEHIDTNVKTEMRDLILEDKATYTDQEKEDIIKYCRSDIKWLPMIDTEFKHKLAELLKIKSEEKIRNIQVVRGRYSSSVAKMEREGMPLDYEAVVNLRRNNDLAKTTLIEDLCTIYPFYVREKPKTKELLGKYVQKADNFEKFLKDNKLYDNWKRTDKGGLAKDDETLEAFDGIKEIYALRQCNKSIKQINWFRKPQKKDDKDFFENVGTDKKLRPFFNPLGTQTGRNAPPSKIFIFAMSKWLRCLVRPKKGEAICAIDWASQEFAIAAVLSKDKNMIESYRSGDPYAYFAKLAGAIPEEANMTWIKNPGLAPENEKDKYNKHKNMRGLFKSTCVNKDTLVRIKGKGWITITNIKKNDYIWDGEQWCSHGGVISRGRKETENYFGIRSTADHRILTERGWKEMQEVRSICEETIVRHGTPDSSWSDVWSLGCTIFKNLCKKWSSFFRL